MYITPGNLAIHLDTVPFWHRNASQSHKMVLGTFCLFDDHQQFMATDSAYWHSNSLNLLTPCELWIYSWTTECCSLKSLIISGSSNHVFDTHIKTRNKFLFLSYSPSLGFRKLLKEWSSECMFCLFPSQDLFASQKFFWSFIFLKCGMNKKQNWYLYFNQV